LPSEVKQLPGAERARGSITDNEVTYVEWNKRKT